MTIPEFEAELKAIDSRLSIVPNPNRSNICNIKLNGVDVCPIPNHEIRDQRDLSYTITMPNGTMVPHKSREEALIMVRNTLEYIKTEEGADLFFGQ